MIGEVLSQHAWLGTLAWHSTLCLAAGLGGSFMLRRRPARAHQVLLITLIGAVAVPALHTVVRQRDWGLFVAKSAPVVTRPAEPVGAAEMPAPPNVAALGQPEYGARLTVEQSDVGRTQPAREFHPARWLFCAWALAGGILLGRLAVRFFLGVRLARQAHAAELECVADLLATAKLRLGITRDVAIRARERLQSPVIWCWSRRPILLIPSSPRQNGHGLDWTSIICHELAHWKRRDHLTGLLVELLLCILPWQPLLWWARRRLVSLSEEACDDWVVACGRSGEDYAETLLGLTPQGRLAFAHSVVSSRKPLVRRIRRILQDSCGNPHPGLRWTIAALALAACTVLGVAFAQTRPAQRPSVDASRQKLNEILDAMLYHDRAVMPIAMHVDIDLYGYAAPGNWRHRETYSSEQRLDGQRLDSILTRYRIEENGSRTHTQNARRVFTGEQYLYWQREIGPAGDRMSASLFPPEQAKQEMAHYFLWGGVLLGYLSGDHKPIAAILRDSPRTILRDEMEAVGGFACHVIESSTDHGVYQIWVDPACDFRIRRAIVYKGPGDMRYGKPITKDTSADPETPARIRDELSDVILEKVADHFIPVAETLVGTTVTTDGTERRSKTVVTRSAIDVRPEFEKLGAFVVDDIPEGTRLTILDPNNRNYGYELRDSRAVPIAPNGPTIAGRITFAGYDTPQDALTDRREFRAVFQTATTTEADEREGKHGIPVRLEKDGTFRIENVPPGMYSLQLALTEWWFKEVASGGRTIQRGTVASANRGLSIAQAGTQPPQTIIDLGDIEMAIEGDRAPSEQTRTLRLPQDRSLGTLYVRDAGQESWYQGWENVGEAKGNRFVGAGKQVKLEVNNETAADLSPLAGLDADDLQMLCFGWETVPVGSLAAIGKLTGLRALNLQSAKFDSDELRHLMNLQDLEVLRLGDHKLTDSSMQYVGQLTSLRSLALWGTGISDAGLRHLQGLTRLTFLALNNCDITDDGLHYLRGMTALEGLQLPQTRISDAGLAHLAHLTRLTHINIDGNKITDAGLSHLEKLSQLENIWLNSNPITDQGFRTLAKMRNLKELYASDTKITEQGLAHLAGLLHLRHIITDRIGDEGLMYLSTLPSLASLQIHDAKVTEASVPSLKAMASLEQLMLSGDIVDDRLLDALRAALPQCKVWDPQRSREYPMPEWRQRFEAVYRLEEGEVLKRIAPPFIPERMDYYRQEHESQAEAIPDGPDSMTFHWDRKLKQWGMSFGRRVGTLNHVLRAVLDLSSYEYEGPNELLDIDLPGDWIVRQATSQEAKLRALEQLMDRQLGWQIRFEKRRVERPVIVATGRFRFEPLAGTQPSERVELYIDELSTSGGGTADSVAELLQKIGDRVGMQVIDRTEPGDVTRIPYNLHRSSRPLQDMENDDEKAALVKVFLDNITKQTQLHFDIRTQPVEVWLLTAENYR